MSTGGTLRILGEGMRMLQDGKSHLLHQFCGEERPKP